MNEKPGKPGFVYFDLGNVLLNFDHRLAAQQMSSVSGADPDLVWKLVFENPLQHKYETGLISSADFYRYFCEQTGTSPGSDELLHAASDIFSLNEEIVPILNQLADQNFPMGILSNTCDAHWRFISDGRFQMLDAFFSTIVLSYEIKSMKPELQIYAEAAKLAGVSPGDIFFTDDRVENVEGAIAAGFDAVLFTDAQKLVADFESRGVRLNR